MWGNKVEHNRDLTSTPPHDPRLRKTLIYLTYLTIPTLRIFSYIEQLPISAFALSAITQAGIRAMSIGSILLSPWAVVAVIGLYYLIPYFQRSSLRNIPGPFIAAFSNLWLLWQCRLTIRSLSVDSAHKKYGKIIRIQPDHISIADDAAIPLVYGHGNGFLKRYDTSICVTPCRILSLMPQSLLRRLRLHQPRPVQRS